MVVAMPVAGHCGPGGGTGQEFPVRIDRCSRCHRCGQANGLQRYRCLGCGRRFNALTGTPLARLRLREKWLPYLQCLMGSDTVRAAAQRVSVAKSTSFRWRHRFLAALRHAPLPRLSGRCWRPTHC
jgi:transposase-like protein